MSRVNFAIACLLAILQNQKSEIPMENQYCYTKEQRFKASSTGTGRDVTVDCGRWSITDYGQFIVVVM